MTVRALGIIGTILLLAIVLSVQSAEADPPVIKSYIQRIDIFYEESVSIDLMDYNSGPVFEDPGGDDLTYGFVTYGEILISVTGSVVTFTGAPGFTGFVSDMVLWAEDEDGSRSEDMFLAFTVMGPEPSPPLVTDFEPNETSVTIQEGMEVNFSILEISESHLADWIFTWYINGKQVIDNDSPVLIFPENEPTEGGFNTSGTYNITVIMQYFWDTYDQAAGRPEWTLTILDVNRRPEVTMVTQDHTVTKGNAIDLQVVAHDGDGDNLTYRWYRSKDGVHLKDAGYGANLVFRKDLSPGKYYFLCEVSDGKNNRTSDKVTITVETETPGPSAGFTAVLLLFMSIISISVRKRGLATRSDR